MKLTLSRLALRISGVAALATAGIRFAMDVSRTLKISEPDPATGFIFGVGIDFTTLALGALGALLCAWGFRAHKNRS